MLWSFSFLKSVFTLLAAIAASSKERFIFKLNCFSKISGVFENYDCAANFVDFLTSKGYWGPYELFFIFWRPLEDFPFVYLFCSRQSTCFFEFYRYKEILKNQFLCNSCSKLCGINRKAVIFVHFKFQLCLLSSSEKHFF